MSLGNDIKDESINRYQTIARENSDTQTENDGDSLDFFNSILAGKDDVSSEDTVKMYLKEMRVIFMPKTY